MKIIKSTIIFCFLLAVLFTESFSSTQSFIILQGGSAASPCAADAFSSDWDIGSTTGDGWTSETDTAGILSVTGAGDTYPLALHISHTSTSPAYLLKNMPSAKTTVAFEWYMLFDDVTAISASENVFDSLLLYDGPDTSIQVRLTTVAGNLAAARIQYKDDSGSWVNRGTNFAFAANTWYRFRLYCVADTNAAFGAGNGKIQLQINDTYIVNENTVDNNAYGSIDSYKFGQEESTLSTTAGLDIYYDDFRERDDLCWD